MNRRTYQSTKVKELTRVWYKKLKDSGFKDIEYKEVLRKGIDWRNYSNNSAEFGRKKSDMESYIWVLEVNAYNNKEIEFKDRRMLMRYLDTMNDKKQHQDFIKTLPHVNYFYYYFYSNKKKLVEFAKQFREVQDE